MVRNHDSSTRVLTFVLTVAFGLLSAVIAYATFKNGSFELRSKAATEEVILKQWTFDKVAEGWEAKDFLSSTITGGMYKLIPHKSKQIAESKKECTTNPKQKKQVCKQVSVMRDLSPRLVNVSVQTNLLYPINKFKIRLAAGLPSGSDRLPSQKEMQENNIRNKPNPPQLAYPITLKVSVKYQGKKVSDAEWQISAVADAKEYEYSFDYPKDSSLKRVDELQISFVGLGTQAGTFVSINDIALVGMKEVRPTPTKKPPVVTQTLTGYVRTHQGEGSLFYTLVLPMIVIGETKSLPPKPVYGKEQEYLLTQNQASPCGEGRRAKLMCRYFAPQKNIDFAQYVDKYVVVMGSVADTKTKAEENPSALPIFIVSTINIVAVVGEVPPTSPIPSVNPVFCTKDALICPDGTSIGRSGLNCEFAACPVSVSPPVVSEYPTVTAVPSPVASSLKILSPNGGESLKIGDMYTIKWDSTNNFHAVDLQYVTDGGFASFIGKGLPETGSFTWQVNSIYGEGNYKIYIYGYTNGYMTANDSSDNFFSLIK